MTHDSVLCCVSRRAEHPEPDQHPPPGSHRPHHPVRLAPPHTTTVVTRRDERIDSKHDSDMYFSSAFCCRVSFVFSPSLPSFLFLLCSGPFVHFWFQAMEKIFAYAGVKPADQNATPVVVGKVAMDQLLFSAPFTALYFYAIGLLQNMPLADIQGKISRDLWPLMIANWKVRRGAERRYRIVLKLSRCALDSLCCRPVIVVLLLSPAGVADPEPAHLPLRSGAAPGARRQHPLGLLDGLRHQEHRGQVKRVCGTAGPRERNATTPHDQHAQCDRAPIDTSSFPIPFLHHPSARTLDDDLFPASRLLASASSPSPCQHTRRHER